MLLFSRRIGRIVNRHLPLFLTRRLVHRVVATKPLFASLLRSCSHPNHLKQIHALILVSGLSIKNSLLTQILETLCLSGDMSYARKLFDEMHKPRAFVWNTLTRGYVRSALFSEALQMYYEMHWLGLRPDEFTFTFALKACAALLDLFTGMATHAMVVKLGLDCNCVLSTELVVMYAKVGDSDYADAVFENMGDRRDLVSWNAIIAAYSQSGRADMALVHFRRMESAGVEPDTISLACALSSCAYLGCFELGKKLHRRIVDGSLPCNIFVENALLDLYSKCGDMEEARILFNEMSSRNVVSWSTIIGGYAINGDSQNSLSFFYQMCGAGGRPNDVTMLNVLSACSHAGLVKLGKALFYSLAQPKIEHCATMVDLLSRSGFFEEAYDFIKTMPMAPDAGIWGALLNACTINRNVELGEIAADHLLKLAPETPSYHVLLSNMYAALGRWSDVEKVREWMAWSRLRKTGGCSSVELDGELHVFYEGSQARSREILQILFELTSTVKSMGYRPQSGWALHDVEEEEKEAALATHSERLALAFSLMRCKSKESPIRVMKNLRICEDCHEFCKYASRATEREIVMRDKSRFHHFRHGQCSCRDYW